MGVFDQAEKLERGQGPTSTSAGNVFDQAQQLDGSKWGNRLTEPSGSTDVGPIAPPAAPLAPWQQGTSPGSLQVEADTSLPTQAGIAVTNAADAAEATKAALGGGRLAKLAALGVRSAGEGAVSRAQELFKTADVEKAGSAATTQAATSAAMGPIGAGASWLGKRAFANILRTAATDFRFGRDPVEAVRNSGIVANSLGD